MKKDKKEAKAKGLDTVELTDKDHINHKKALKQMKEHDAAIDDSSIEQEYEDRRIKHE